MLSRRRSLLLLLLAGTAVAGCAERRVIPAAEPVALRSAETGGALTARSRPRSVRIKAGASERPSPGLIRYGAAVREPVIQEIPPAASAGPRVTLNLTDVSIEAMAAKVIGDLLGTSYVVEDDFEGLASLRTERPMTTAEILALFEAVLASRGGAMILQNGTYRIVRADPDSPALRTAPLDTGRGVSFGYATRAVRLRHGRASEIAELIRSVAPEGAIRSVDDRRGVILLSGNGAQLNELERLIATFDADWLQGLSLALLPVARADPARVAAEISFTISEETGADARTRVRAIDRARAVLVVSPNPGAIRTARQLLPYLDYAGEDDRSIYLVRVQNRSADELAELLQTALADGPLPEAAAPGGEPLTQEASFAPPEARGGAPGGFSVTADPSGNNLIIRARSEVYADALAIIERLDTVPDQVLLEVTIAEIALADELRYGLEYFLRFGDFEGAFTGNLAGLVAPAAPGLSLLLSGTNGGVVLNALEGLTDLTVISAPSLMVLDNSEAILQIGDQVPVITQSSVSTGDPDAPIVNSIVYRDTGITMRVRPRIGDDGMVLLEIEQDVSDVVETTTSEIDSPTIRQRRVVTRVAVQDGESLALGGLIRNANGDGETGIPILKDIPVAGELFKTTEASAERTELLITITPRVVRSPVEARAVTEELRARLVSMRAELDL
ncbi:MAG: type II secretion system secretin GspD [Paracoccaceae bacterium]